MTLQRLLTASTLGVTLLYGQVAFAQSAEHQAWLESAQLGEFQPATEDWDAIKAAAILEGEVTVYSSSSSIAAVAEDFQALYPEIKVNAFDLGSEKTIEKLVREHGAGLYNVDVVTSGGAAQMIHELLPNNLIVNYVPRNLVDAIPEALREPLLTQVIEATALFYNTENYPDGPPINNIWELTEPEWNTRVGLKSPLGSLTALGMMATMVEHADKFAAAYELHTGNALTLSDGIENAGYEFLHRLIQNDVVIYSSGSKLAAASGLAGQTAPPITLSSMHYINKNETDGYLNAILTDIEPAGVIAYSTYTSIAGQAPHPNAAKLFVAFQMGSADLTPETVVEAPFREGQSLVDLQGLATFFKNGVFSPRTDAPLPVGAEEWTTMDKLWGTPAFQRDNVAKVSDFWIYETSQ